MGQAVVEAVNEAADCVLVAAVDIGVPPTALNQAGAEVIVDFSTIDAVMRTLKSPSATGSTASSAPPGSTTSGLTRCARGAPSSPEVGVLIAPNFGIGAVLMMRFAEMAAPYFDSAEIVELHHPDKADAPSGTATHTAQLIAAARAGCGRPAGRDDVRGAGRAWCHDRRRALCTRCGRVAWSPIRRSSSAALGETLTIRHDSLDRSSFMPGVLFGVRNVGRHPGLTVGLAHYLDLGA